MTDDQRRTYELLVPLIKAKDVRKFIAAMRKPAVGPRVKVSANELAYYVEKMLSALIDRYKADSGLPIVQAYLALVGRRIPADPQKRWMLASSALRCIKGKPGLAIDIERTLLGGPVNRNFLLDVAWSMAALGHAGRSLVYALHAVDAGADLSSLLNDRAIKKLYNSDAKFKQAVDAAFARRAARLERLADPRDFATTLEAAGEELRKPYYQCQPARILAVLPYAGKGHRAEVQAFLAGGFDQTRDHARESGDLISTVAFDALARALGRLGNPALGKLAMREFAYVTEKDDERITDGVSRHYELNLVGGTLALAVAALDYRGSLRDFDRFFEGFESYDGDDFVMQTRYAKWVLQKDAAGALQRLDAKNKNGLGYAVCALADLNHKRALPVLKAQLASLKNKVTVQIFQEAIARLERQKKAPPPDGRMVRLFGDVTSTEQAHDVASDNQFVLRARRATRKRDLGEVREVDDAAPDDR